MADTRSHMLGLSAHGCHVEVRYTDRELYSWHIYWRGDVVTWGEGGTVDEMLKDFKDQLKTISQV